MRRASQLLLAASGRIGFVDALTTDIAQALEGDKEKDARVWVAKAKQHFAVAEQEAIAAANLLAAAQEELADARKVFEAQLAELDELESEPKRPK